MCVPEAEQVGQEIENMDNSNNSSNNNNNNNKVTRPLHCEVLHTQIEKWDKESPLMSSTDQFCLESSFPLRFQFLYHLFLLGFFQIINIYIYIYFEDHFGWNWVLCICFLMWLVIDDW